MCYFLGWAYERLTGPIWRLWDSPPGSRRDRLAHALVPLVDAADRWRRDLRGWDRPAG